VKSRTEFIALMAAMAALDAFSIDAMLPALEQIGSELGVSVANHRQYVITFLFLGFSIGVLVYGFVADRFGRRLPAMAGFCIYLGGSLLCITADSFNVLLFGRVLQGLGAAGPYVLSVAIVRDLYQGRDMAQILSLIMMVFIGIPMIAPMIGQGVLEIAGWRTIFTVMFLYGGATLTWFWLRQAETLDPANCQSLSAATILQSVKEVLTHRQSLTYLMALAAVFGSFIAYLSTAQQVFQGIYQLGRYFPVVFASLASMFGIASWFNARWVHDVGSRKLVHYALLSIVLASVIFCLLPTGPSTSPPLWSFVLYMMVIMAGFAFLFGNITSLALEPMGHIAGAASSLVNSLSTAAAIALATLIGSRMDGNIYPIVVGFGVLCLIAAALNYTQLKSAVSKQDSV